MRLDGAVFGSLVTANSTDARRPGATHDSDGWDDQRLAEFTEALAGRPLPVDPFADGEIPSPGVCHADRAALLMEVARCAHNWEELTAIWFTEAEDWPDRMRAAEAALIAACARLAQIPDCSE